MLLVSCDMLKEEMTIAVVSIVTLMYDDIIIPDMHCQKRHSILNSIHFDFFPCDWWS